ncbi:MAG TPA: histidine kinase [Candidatus Angelobacter sp.]
MSTHGSIIGSTLEHCAGIVWCSILLYLLFDDWRRSREDHGHLPMCAAALALLWNIGGLAVLGSGIETSAALRALHAISLAALSVLPAVVLHIWLGRRCRPVCIAGYGLSSLAVGLQLWSCFSGSTLPFRPALTLIAVGFAGLTAVSMMLDLRQVQVRGDGLRLVSAMGLLLLSIFFFVYFNGSAGRFHHAAISVSLFILLVDYRFLLLDAFLRFAVKSALAVAIVVSGFVVESRLRLMDRAAENQFAMALLLIAACVVLVGLARLSAWVEDTIIRHLFQQPDVEPILAELRTPRTAEDTEEHYLSHVRDTMEKFFKCRLSRFQLHLQARDLEDLDPFAFLRKPWLAFPSAPWARVALPLRFSRGDALVLLLGPRRGRRQYLRHDIVLLARFARVIEGQIERRRHLEMQDLASKAELKALQAQINPHFFFNSLTTLYGTISRDNADARRLVLNLADLFRYFLRSDRTFVTLDEELKIVRAYMEIEALRLGSKLATAIHVGEHLLNAEVPVLSIQPLVENAIKHGVASRTTQGFVYLKVRAENNHLCVEVVNTGGEFRVDSGNGERDGIGLANVQRRLELCYGFDTEFYISSRQNQTMVGFFIPLIRSDLDTIDPIGLTGRMRRTA